VEIRSLGRGDEEMVIAASGLFDGPADERATSRFLAEDGHHILVAYEQGDPVGFVTGVEVTHPDKGTEMFLYELAVEGGFRRSGIGRALVEELARIAQERGCYGMWVLTDGDNAAALATYESSGGSVERGQAVVVWTF
jgi:ribosomal protein S18 acetylase RimI-like enzyme